MTKNIYLLLFSLIAYSTVAQKKGYNIQNGYIAKGYDVVAYFDNKALEGKDSYQITYDGVKFKFSSKENLIKFNANPPAYTPQYGGWCAYAIAKDNSKVKINPKSFKIQDGKLYLFYHTIFGNTLVQWNNENPLFLQKKADENWKDQRKVIR